MYFDSKSSFPYLQPQGLDELTIERVQDDVEIETEGQTDAFAVSNDIIVLSTSLTFIELLLLFHLKDCHRLYIIKCFTKSVIAHKLYTCTLYLVFNQSLTGEFIK